MIECVRGDDVCRRESWVQLASPCGLSACAGAAVVSASPTNVTAQEAFCNE